MGKCGGDTRRSRLTIHTFRAGVGSLDGEVGWLCGYGCGLRGVGLNEISSVFWGGCKPKLGHAGHVGNYWLVVLEGGM